MRSTIWFAGTVAALVLIATATAQPPGGRGFDSGPPPDMLRMLPLMMALDTDEDGEISAKEMRRATAALKELDADGNGKLTADELRPQFPAGGPGGPGGPDSPAGANGREGPGGAGPAGARGSRDVARQRNARGPGGPGGPPNADGFIQHAMEFDADGDGKLSKDELAKFAEQMARGPRPPS